MGYDRRISMLLCIHIGMLGYAAYAHSPTIDEAAYLVAGISHWHFGSFEITRVSPPLVRLVAAIPVTLASPKLDWHSVRRGTGVRGEHLIGNDFIAANGRRTFWLFAIARWACIPFSLLGAFTCYRWSFALWGRRSAFAALMLWCFCPNVLAHGALMTPDVGVTALSLSAAYLYWRWFVRRTWIHAGIAGAVLGLAILAKTNAVVLIPTLPLIAVFAATIKPHAQTDWTRFVGQLIVAGIVSIYVLNVGYNFEGSLTRLDQYEFVSHTFRGPTEKANFGNRFKGHFVGQLPVPLPKPFLEGIDIQRKDFENDTGEEKTYFCGQWYDRGWWWYYLYVVAVKVPPAVWTLLLVAIVVHFAQNGFITAARPEALFVLVPGSALFIVACSQTGIGHGLRYVLPALPFVFVFASSAFRDGITTRKVIATGWALVACHVVSSVTVYPHSLSYFNLVAGGPANGHAHLLDGNLDWGQDFLYLEDWIKAHPEAKPLHVACWGFLPVESLQADYSDLDFQPDLSKGIAKTPKIPPGWYAISVNNLRGDPNVDNEKYYSFLARKPTARIGYTIYVYHVLPAN